MKVIKKAIIILFSLILVSLIGMILKIILVEGAVNFLKSIRYFGIGYSECQDFLLFFIIGCFLIMLHKLVKILLGKGSSCFTQGISTGILGVLLFCLFAGFVTGFGVAFRLTNERLIALIPLFSIGFLLPFSERWITILLNKIWKK